MMTAARMAEKKELSFLTDFDNRSIDDVQNLANNLSTVLNLIYYKSVDSGILVKNMCEQLSRYDDLSSQEGRDMLHLATTDLITILEQKAKFYTALLAQCETEMNLELKGENND